MQAVRQLLSSILTLLLCLPFTLSQTPTPSSTAPSIIEQPILHPARSDILEPGGVFTIQWTPDPHFSNVTIELWDKTSWGYSRDFGSLCYHWVNPFCGTIVSHSPNTGTYEWHIPNPGSDFPRGERAFWIKMYVDDYSHPEVGNKDPVLSYSQNFAFAPKPGQEVPAMVDSSTTGEVISIPTGDTMLGSAPGTVYVTVYDGSTSFSSGTTELRLVSATSTGVSMESTQPALVQGAGSKLQGLSSTLLILLGLLRSVVFLVFCYLRF